MTLPVPYPADTRAKGWRFEIDYEKVEQSDTWDLAAEVAMAQPALLMMWLVAWKQVPCGSMPNDEDVIRAKCRIPAETWPILKVLLMRGWWMAEDGRLYHDTIVQRVREMLEYRAKEAGRKSRNRGKTAAVPDVSRGTDDGQHRDSAESHDTGTGTGTYTPPIGGVARPSAGEACKAMKAAGLGEVSPSHPKLISLLDAGITLDELVDATKAAIKAKKASFPYVLATAEGRRRDSATDSLPAAGAAPRNGTHKYAAAAAGIFGSPKHQQGEVIDV